MNVGMYHLPECGGGHGAFYGTVDARSLQNEYGHPSPGVRKTGSAARTLREGCPYDLDLKWCDLPECVGYFGAHRGTARRPFPTLH